MNAQTTELDEVEEAVLTFEVSDEGLEAAAAGSLKEKVGSFTLAFCSGLDTCPS